MIEGFMTLIFILLILGINSHEQQIWQLKDKLLVKFRMGPFSDG